MSKPSIDDVCQAVFTFHNETRRLLRDCAPNSVDQTMQFNKARDALRKTFDDYGLSAHIDWDQEYVR